MSLSSSAFNTLHAPALVAACVVLAIAGDVLADRYSFNESSGSWSDPENWQNSNPEGPEGPPGGDDEAVFAVNTTVNLDSSVAVGHFDVIQGDTTLALGGHTLNVINLRQFRVASGGQGSLTLTAGAVSSNGLAVGLGGDGTLTIPSGASVSDSDEIDIGYTNKGTLKLTGGLVESKRIFLGGFASGVGTVEISNAATLRANADYIVIGNVGQGKLSVSDGGKAEAARVIVGSFNGSNGEATFTGGSSMLNAQTHLHVGFSGAGKLTIDEGAKATTNDLRIGDLAGSSGELHITGNGSSVDVGLGGAYFGPGGTSHSRIESGGKLNVAGGGPIHLGGESTGNGILNIEGQSSTLNAPDSVLELGKDGVGQLHLSGGAMLNVKQVEMSSGAGKTSQFTIGSQTKVQLPSSLLVQPHGKAETQITGSSELSALFVSLSPRAGGEAITTVRGAGSVLRSTEAVSLGTYQDGYSELTVDQGGKLIAPWALIGDAKDSLTVITLNGASSKLDVPGITVGGAGIAALNLEDGAEYRTNHQLVAGDKSTGEGTINVEGGASLHVGSGMTLGVVGAGGLRLQNHGRVTVTGPVEIGYGVLEVESGSSVTLGSTMHMADAAEQITNIALSGSGSRLEFKEIYGGNGLSQVGIYGGSTMTGDLIEALHTTGERTILVGGGRLQANKIRLLSPKDGLIINAGGHVWAVSTLDMGRGSLTVEGGSVDVGYVFPPTPEIGFIRVGHGGYFNSEQVVANVRDMGGWVQTPKSRALSITGDFFQQSGGVLGLNISGPTAGEDYSQLDVSGDLQLAGIIRVAFQDGFAPQPGQTFDLITVGGTAQLDNVEIEIGNLAPGFTFDFSPVAGGYRLTALSAGQFVAPQAGDFNEDGFVDGLDLTVWRTGFGSVADATPQDGDADGDQDVDGADFLAWQQSLGEPAATAAAAAVPEPPAGTLVGAALASLLALRANRGQR